jgi:hypothetical protein
MDSNPLLIWAQLWKEGKHGKLIANERAGLVE